MKGEAPDNAGYQLIRKDPSHLVRPFRSDADEMRTAALERLDCADRNVVLRALPLDGCLRQVDIEQAVHAAVTSKAS